MTEAPYHVEGIPLEDFPRHLRNCAALPGSTTITLTDQATLRLARIIEEACQRSLPHPPAAPPPAPPAKARVQPIAGWLWWLSGVAIGLTMGLAVLPAVLP